MLEWSEALLSQMALEIEEQRPNIIEQSLAVPLGRRVNVK